MAVTDILNDLAPVDEKKHYLVFNNDAELSDKEEAALLSRRRGVSIAKIIGETGLTRRYLERLFDSERAKIFYGALSRQFAILKASRVAESAWKATNCLESIIDDESLLEVEDEDTYTNRVKLKISAAAELLRTDAKLAPQVSMNIDVDHDDVKDALVRRLRGEVVDVESGVMDVKPIDQ